jgi:hypothetical protein
VAQPAVRRIYEMRSPEERVSLVATMKAVLPPPASEGVSGLLAQADPEG